MGERTMECTSGVAAALTAMLVVATTMAGCSEDPGAEPVADSEASAPVVEQEDVNQAAMDYVEALASQDLATMRRAQKASADGSLAQAYMRHQANGAESMLDGGYPTDAAVEVAEGHDDVLRTCYESEDSSEKDCYEYGDFKVNKDGELASFTIDGKTLNGRLTVGNGNPTATSLANFVFDSAYIFQNGNLSVSGQIKTKNTKVFIEAGSNYRSPNGRVRAMSSSSGLSNFPANSRSAFTAYFNGPIEFGGEMNLVFIEDGGAYSQATATVKIK